MRKLIFAINLTLDGCCDHTKGIADEELHEYYVQLLRDFDTFVYGRKTYQLMVPFWPDTAKNNSGTTKAMNDFAQAFDAVKKIVVVSRTLESVEEKKTSIVRENLRDEILKLKNQEGKKILTGGVDIPSQLIQLGLVDEYNFVIQPLVVGEGRRLLERTTLQEKLQLVESKVFASGCVALRYRKG
jgi:dihydrofolate reductase